MAEDVIISVLAFLLAIGILVAVHEYGHYIVARWVGIRVLRFSIGFGKPLLLRRWGKDQTEYCLSAIPLGGYVKLLDEREEEVDPSEVHRAFNRQPILARIAVLAAGPGMNFVFAVFAYWLMFVIGIPGAQPIIGDVVESSIAADAGFRPQDRISRVEGREVATWEGAILSMLDEMLEDGQIAVEVVDESGGVRQLNLNVGSRVNELTEPGKLFSGLGFSPWAPVIPAVLDSVTADGAAKQAGLQAGDELTAADGVEIEDWPYWVNYVRERPNVTVRVQLLRAGEQMELDITIGSVVEKGLTIGRIGAIAVVPEGLLERYSADQRYGWAESVPAALERTWSMAALTVRMVGSMVVGDVSVKNISGPINIAEYAGYSVRVGLAPFLNFLAIVSISLGILNFLPIPVLDGGQIVFQTAEAIKGGPLPERIQLIGQQIGILFLVLIMSFAFYNDLSRFFN
jgi:regulator of sigma E protease